MDVLYIKISDEYDIDLCVTFLNFQTSSRSSCLVNTITLQELPVSFCNFPEIFSRSKSRTSLMFTFLTFWNKSCSNGNILKLLVNMIKHQNLSASCCNSTGSDVLLIRISTKFDLDLCVTFINFQASSIWEDLVNAITFRRLPVSCCNFTWMFST